MEKVRLEDVCEILNGYAFKSELYQESGTRVIRITNVQKGYIEDIEPKFYDIHMKSELAKYMLFEKDLLISLTGNVGRVGLLKKEMLPAALNQRVGCIRVLNNLKLDKDYLFNALNNNFFENECIKNSKGIAQKNLSTEWLKEYKINLPPIEQQKQIANKLGKLQEIIDIRKKQIEELDELIKAKFAKMFENNNYYTSSLGEISKVITKGTTPTSIGFNFINDGEVNFIKIESIDSNGFFIKEKFASISKECNKKLKRSTLEENDILFSIAGAIGRTAIVTKDILPANTNQAIAIIRVDNQDINNVFLESMLKSDFVKKQYNRKKQGVAQINLSLKDISELNIYIPPIELQEQFTEFVKKINKQKFKIQKSLEETKKMQDSLMNKYFG